MIGKLTLKLKKWGNTIFARFFGFEEGIDITNDVAVLHRRNVVIKNIIFLSNLGYSLLLLFLSITAGNQTDWVITFVSFPFTLMVNQLLKTLIKSDEKDYTKQQIASYVTSFYIFIISLLMYAKLQGETYETASYVLMFYSIVVISLYQDKKVLTGSFLSILLIMTVVHLIYTYNLQELSKNMGFSEFIKTMFSGENLELSLFLSDIILRTLVFLLFYLVVYTIVSIGQYMQVERKNELIKRRQVQNDFSEIVSGLFSTVLVESTDENSKKHDIVISKISLLLADFIGHTPSQKQHLKEFTLIHNRYNEVKDLNFDDEGFSDKEYDVLKVKTELGTRIIKRVQISKKAETIIRSLMENTNSSSFIEEMNLLLPDQESQIVLIASLYVTLRISKPYKRPLPHRDAVRLLTKDLSVFYDDYLLLRVNKISDELDNIYNGA